MIVDDDKNSLLSLQRALSLHGYDTESFNDPFDALKKYNSNDYAVVVTDYKMPAMDGITLIKAIRGINPRAKVIMFSGYIDASLLDKITALDIEAIYHKPLPLESLLTKLDSITYVTKKRFDSTIGSLVFI